MGELRDFVAEMLDRHGAAVEAIEPDGLEVLAPEPVREALGWPELARLGFGAQRPEQAIAIGLEGDWLERFGTLLGARGRWAERHVIPQGAVAAPGDPQRILEHTLSLPNAIWRFQSVTPAVARCLMLAFRYTAVSDEKREGLVWLGFNLATGAAVGNILTQLRSTHEWEADWQVPEPDVRHAAGPMWDDALLAARVRPTLDHCVRQDLDPFLRAMRRRLERDRNRVHAYHDDLRGTSLNRIAALADGKSEKAEADRKREQLRVAAIEREYQAKLGDLRHNYALRVTVAWVQALDVYLPVQRFEVLIRRRKGERRIRMDWHPLVRAIEPPLCEWGLGLDGVRLVCDEKLHLTEPAGQSPCSSCGKAWCRGCHAACPRCGET
ncbi:MAG: hypothetical protein ACREC6_07230 [Hyphomicrobiaceae bacterium]